LLETRNNEVRDAIVKQVVDRVVSLKSKLEEIKEKAVSEGGVYLSEAEIVSDTLDCYERIAERNEFYIRIV
jgi:hypothetical protein